MREAQVAFAGVEIDEDVDILVTGNSDSSDVNVEKTEIVTPAEFWKKCFDEKDR